MDPRLVVALLMFLGASLSDLRTRRVPNAYWVPFLAAAAAFLAGDAMQGRLTWAALLWAAGTSAAVYFLWRGHLYGGADAKALMLLAWLWPDTPDLATRFTPAIDTLVAATFLMVGLPLVFLLVNAARGDLAFPATLLGIRMDAPSAARRHVWPMQTVRDGQLAWRYMQRPGLDAAAEVDALRRQGLERIWVTPKIPFMVPLSLGLLLQARFGDLVLRAMAALLT